MKTEDEKLQDEFEEKANAILEHFLESLKEDGFTIDLDGEDENSEYGTHIGEGFTFVYTSRGGRLARTMISRLQSLADKKFTNHNISIESHLYREL